MRTPLAGVRRSIRKPSIRFVGMSVRRAYAHDHQPANARSLCVEVDMCRNIRTLFNFEPPASEMEIRDASLQFVRKLSGFNTPSKANQAAFDRAVEDIANVARTLMNSLTTTAQPKNRDVEAGRAKARSAIRFKVPQ